ncbi:MAG: transcription termination/antitermination protein NusA, partial [Chloroflexi bacterium]|nr:transcription termination/antitermination protein NusA [Chloroflexota bacterium]
MKSDFLIAVTQLAAERGLPREKVIAAVEAALASAYKKDTIAAGHDITVRLNPSTGEVKTYLQKAVVEVVADSRKELSLAEAVQAKPDARVGDTVEFEADFPAAGRIAAQIAKQVVLQRLREAERELVLAEYTSKIGDILPGRVERIEPAGVIVNLGRTGGVMPREEQIPTERPRPTQTLQFLLVRVDRSPKGPELI